MITFSYLDKSQKEQWLSTLFDLYYRNMQAIIPTSLPYEEEKTQWLSEVSPALEKEPRKIILCLAESALAGYVQYYTNKNLLMIEEIQIAKDFQRTILFYSLCKHLVQALPPDLETIEAFALKQNLYSRKLMNRLGMEQIEENDDFVHMRGSIQNMKRFF